MGDYRRGSCGQWDIYQDFEKENPDVKAELASMPSGSETVRKVEDMLCG